MTISRWLNSHHFNYKSEYSFSDCLTENNYEHFFDFALFDNNNNLLGLIEYQGSIHYIQRTSGWNNQKSFNQRVKRDAYKKQYCKEKNIKLFEITYLENIEERLEEITNELYS